MSSQARHELVETRQYKESTEQASQADDGAEKSRDRNQQQDSKKIAVCSLVCITILFQYWWRVYQMWKGRAHSIPLPYSNINAPLSCVSLSQFDLAHCSALCSVLLCSQCSVPCSSRNCYLHCRWHQQAIHSALCPITRSSHLSSAKPSPD